MQLTNIDVQGLLRNASGLFRAGRVDEAIVAYERLLRACPDLPNSWFNLAMLQRRVRRFDEALGSYQRALDVGIEMPEEVHLQRGVIFSDDLDRSDSALGELRAALALNPNYVPALLNLGNIHEDKGDRASAQSAYERVLALEPENVLALSRLAGLAPLERADDPLLEKIGSLIARPDLAPAERADLGFALGAALDRIGGYDRAFRAYAAANSASRAMAPGRRYDRQAQESLVDRLIAAFPPRKADADAEFDHPAPAFICGMFRSGSTLAERILARHSLVAAGGELDVVPALIRANLTGYPESAAMASAEDLAVLRNHYLAATSQRHSPGTLLTDKRPDNFVHLGLIKRMFPTARIIHTKRNPLDTCLSIYFLHASPELDYATDLANIAHYYGQYRRLMDHWRSLWPDDIFELDYDRLVTEPNAMIGQLLRFVGLGWEEAVLSHQTGSDAVRTASNWQVRRPLYRDSSGRWRNYRQHLNRLITALNDELGDGFRGSYQESYHGESNE